jgi:enoyl-CoA hydratase/carnithine racemase
MKVSNAAHTCGPLAPGQDARVRCDIDGPIATITLTRPDRRNAQTPITWKALRAMGSDLPSDVRVVIVRGEGAAFSAGLDRAMFTPEGLPGVPTFIDVAHAPAGEAERIVEGFQEAFAWLGRPDIVSVAAVHGHAIGAGFQLALACDLRVAAQDAEFRMAETALGLVPDLGGTRILRELVGYSRALEICATGRQIVATEAARIGLVNLIVPRDDLDAAVADLVTALLAPPRDAVSETKALLLGAALRSPAEQLHAERQAQLRRIRHLANVHPAAPPPSPIDPRGRS